MTVDDLTTGTRLDRRSGGCDPSHGPNPKSARHRGSPPTHRISQASHPQSSGFADHTTGSLRQHALAASCSSVIVA